MFFIVYWVHSYCWGKLLDCTVHIFTGDKFSEDERYWRKETSEDERYWRKKNSEDERYWRKEISEDERYWRKEITRVYASKEVFLVSCNIY